jgi:hypothetical protein
MDVGAECPDKPAWIRTKIYVIFCKNPKLRFTLDRVGEICARALPLVDAALARTGRLRLSGFASVSSDDSEEGYADDYSGDY